jgi:hypothetical protein
MGGGAGQRLREHDPRSEERSERRGREIGGGRECSGASILGWEMCSRDGAMAAAEWVLEVGDATRCWVAVMGWV